MHLHAYRVNAKLMPGQSIDVSFKAFATGRFRIEWHAATDQAGTPGAHRAPPLATLEVRPK